MEIFVHTITDLNRCLNLGLYILVDSEKIALVSLTNSTVLKDMSSQESLTFYLYLTELNRLIRSWDMNRLTNKLHVAYAIRDQILQKYHFDINKHYKINKYGTI